MSHTLPHVLCHTLSHTAYCLHTLLHVLFHTAGRIGRGSAQAEYERGPAVSYTCEVSLRDHVFLSSKRRKSTKLRKHVIIPARKLNISMPWNHPIKEGIYQNTSNCEANTAVPILSVQAFGRSNLTSLMHLFQRRK